MSDPLTVSAPHTLSGHPTLHGKDKVRMRMQKALFSSRVRRVPTPSQSPLPRPTWPSLRGHFRLYRNVERTSHTLQEPTPIRNAQRGEIITITYLQLGYDPLIKSKRYSRSGGHLVLRTTRTARTANQKIFVGPRFRGVT
jgi:hypothetical protein